MTSSWLDEWYWAMFKPISIWPNFIFAGFHFQNFLFYKRKKTHVVIKRYCDPGIIIRGAFNEHFWSYCVKLRILDKYIRKIYIYTIISTHFATESGWEPVFMTLWYPWIQHMVPRTPPPPPNKIVHTSDYFHILHVERLALVWNLVLNVCGALKHIYKMFMSFVDPCVI